MHIFTDTCTPLKMKHTVNTVHLLQNNNKIGFTNMLWAECVGALWLEELGEFRKQVHLIASLARGQISGEA